MAPSSSTPPVFPTRPATNGGTLMLHDQLLGTKHYFYTLARFAVALGIIAGALFARWVMGMAELDVTGLIILAVILFVYNIGIFVHARRFRDQPTTEDSRPVLVGLMNGCIAIDFVFLTVALWMVGGAQSPFKAFYILHVIIAAVLLPRRMAYAHATLGYLLFALLALAEWRQWIPIRFPEGAVASPQAINGRFLITILGVQGLLLAITVFLLTRLTRRLREGEREMRQAQIELERFSDMQRNFLRIAMHDAKSPVSGAISLLYNMQAELLGPLTDPQRQTTDRILERLQSVLSLFRDFEVLSALDSVSPEMQGTPVDMGRMVSEIIKAHSDQAGVHGHTLTADIADDLPPVQGIETLLRESVVNLVTNAIKYTPDGGRIAIRAQSVNGERDGATRGQNGEAPPRRVRIEVEDNGIGISPEDQEKLFKEFVRIRRQDRPLRDQGGSGLGLSNVRRIIELHNGQFGVRSAQNQGSLFFLELPGREG